MDSLQQKLAALRNSLNPELLVTPDFPLHILLRRFWLDERPLEKKLLWFSTFYEFLGPYSLPNTPLTTVPRGFFTYEMSQLSYMTGLTTTQIYHYSLFSIKDSSLWTSDSNISLTPHNLLSTAAPVSSN